MSLDLKIGLEQSRSSGYIAVPNRPWVDRIRTLGNEANHELPLATKEQAEMALDFSDMLLKTLYEYAQRAKAPAPEAP
jgi:hypothetical protein